MNSYVEEYSLKIETFLATQYFINGFDGGDYFDAELGGIVHEGYHYHFSDDKLIVNGNEYSLPDRWEERKKAYEEICEVFEK